MRIPSTPQYVYLPRFFFISSAFLSKSSGDCIYESREARQDAQPRYFENREAPGNKVREKHDQRTSQSTPGSKTTNNNNNVYFVLYESKEIHRIELKKYTQPKYIATHTNQEPLQTRKVWPSLKILFIANARYSCNKTIFYLTGIPIVHIPILSSS